MDRIRENAFGIGVGALSLLLLVFLYVWVISPLMAGIPDQQSGLTRQKSKLKNYNDPKKFESLPTMELVNSTKRRQEDLEAALNGAIRLYSDRGDEFSEFFEGVFNPDPATFKAKSETEIQSLVERYHEKFPESRPVGDEGATDYVPGIEVLAMENFLAENEVNRGMKEYWVIEQVFASATKLELGGLKKIEFPLRDRKDAVEGLPEHYDVVRSKVTIVLPMSKLAALVRDLLASDRVPFELWSCEAHKKAETLIAGLVTEKTYENEELKKARSDKEEHPIEKPLVEAVLELWAIDWKGFPQKPETKA